MAPVALTAESTPGKRPHVRAIIRDGSRAFGSQSLRKLERRREIGLIVDDAAVVRRFHQVPSRIGR